MTSLPTGFVSQTHSGDAPLEEWIERGGSAGFDFVEVYMDGATARESLDPAAVARTAESSGVDLSVHLPFADLDLGTPRDRVRDASVEELEACLRAAAEMDAEKAVVHPSSHASWPEWDADAVRPRIHDAVTRLDGFAADRGIELCAENLPVGYYTLGAFDSLLDATDVSMTFDTGHARADGFDERDVAAFLDEHRNRVSHVHVNDGRADEDEHVPTGSGTTDFATALAPLAEGWEGTLSIEVFTFDFDYVEMSRRKLHAAI